MKIDDKLLERVEREIIIKGAASGEIQIQKDKVVPLREGKLAGTDFGEFLGKNFDYDGLLAINWYGYYKLSDGIERAVESVVDIFPGVRSIKADVIHFNSIRTEAARSIAGDDKDLFLGYIELKSHILGLRFPEKAKKCEEKIDDCRPETEAAHSPV